MVLNDEVLLCVLILVGSEVVIVVGVFDLRLFLCGVLLFVCVLIDGNSRSISLGFFIELHCDGLPLIPIEPLILGHSCICFRIDDNILPLKHNVIHGFLENIISLELFVEFFP